MAVIYQITNMVNNKYYIGSAQSYERRVWQHKNELGKGTHKNPRIQASWNKYGAEAFVFEILEVIPEGEDQLIWENKYLHIHVGKPECYNINRDAEAPRIGQTLNAESRKKLSVNRTGKAAGEAHYRYGEVVSEEVRKKIGDAQRGVKKNPRVYTEEGLRKARENMARNAKEQVVTPFTKVLAKFPQEVKDKYDFTNAVYTGALERITGCFCESHGEFSQYAAQFRKGRGCPTCGVEKRAESKRKQMKEFWATEEGRSKFIESRQQTTCTKLK
jgi:group I intron endonuclease